MVRHVSPPDLSDGEATRLVTLIFSAYAMAQFGTNILWGRLSDRIGRRPVLLFGLAGVFVSTVALAFSSSVPLIFVSRIAAGLLSGNIVITRTMIGDMVHGRENKSRAFAWNQTVYQIGTVVGPFIGGFFVQPCTQMPSLCSDGRLSFFRAYPFALPNLIIASLVATSWTVAYCHLKEVSCCHPRLTACRLTKQSLVKSKPATLPDETSPLLASNDPVSATSPSTTPSRSSKILTDNVVHLVICYGIMALHCSCFDQITPVFLSTAERKTPAADAPSWLSQLFHLTGGLGYSSITVASFISAAGLLSIALMVFIFPTVDTYFGSLTCLRGSVSIYPAMYLLLPYLVMLPASPGWVRFSAVSALFAAKTLAAVFSFNDSAILLNVAAPSPEALGFVNGVAQTAANGARALGPAIMGFFISLGDRFDTNVLGWWFLAVVGGLGVGQALLIYDEEEL